MSLIADALKTAQREKQARESGGGPGGISPVLVPLRPQSQSVSSLRQTLTIVISGIVIVASVVVMVQRMKKAPVAPLSPMTSFLPSTAASAESSSKGASKKPTVSRVTVSRDVARPPSAGSRQASGGAARVIAQATPLAGAKSDTGPVPQGQLKSDSSAPISPAPSARDAQPTGRLRIAVEQPREAEAARLFAEALAAHRAGDLATARALYERVLILAPNDADALNNLGVLLSAQRDFDRALNLLRRAASVAPRSAGTWNNIGTTLREQGRGSDAVAAYQHALTLDPQHQGAKVGLAQQYLAIGSVTQARELLEDVLAANPALAEAHYALGQALELQGDRAGAIREYSAFMRLAPARLAEHVERTRRHVDSLSSRSP